VATIPPRAIPQTPGGRHGVLWVAHQGSHRKKQGRSVMGRGMSTTPSNPRSPESFYIHLPLLDHMGRVLKPVIVGTEV
jgi:hypothetical protein